MKSIAKYEENVKKQYRIFCIFDRSGPRGLQCSETRLIPEEPLLLPLFCPALPQPTGNASRCGGCRKYGCGGDYFPSAGSRPDGLAELSTQVWRGVFSVLLGVCNRFNRAPEPAGYERPQKHAGHGYGNRARHKSSPPLTAGIRRARRSRRRLAEARQGRASAAVVAAQIHGQAMRPWLSTPSCRRPYGAQPPNRPVIQSQTRAKKPEVSSVSASGSGVGAGETFGI